GGPSPGGAGKPPRTKTEGSEIGVGVKPAIASSRPGACAETFEAAETGFALSVDLAAIEGLALVLVAEQFMCGVQLGETGGCFGIVLVGVGMQFFGEPAVGAFDLACIRLAIYAQDFVGITHPPGNSTL